MPTAIVWIHTAEGVVIASDGRNAHPETGQVQNDETQKIFPIGQLDGRLAYALAGSIRFGSEDGVVLDLEIEMRNALTRMHHQTKNWFNYVSNLTSELDRLIAQAKASSSRLLRKPTETWIFVVGLFGKHSKSAHIVFQHGNESTESEQYLHPPGFNAPFGSKRIFELVDLGEGHFSKYTIPKRDAVRALSDAIERAKNDILAHCDPEALNVDNETCRGIGGRVQIATITRSAGFAWVPGFEPTGAIIKRTLPA